MWKCEDLIPAAKLWMRKKKEGHTSGEEVKTIISLWCKREANFSFSKASIIV
jgi:hypothetical protein